MRRGWAAVVAAGIIGCGKDPTELLVVIDSDIADLGKVQISAKASGQAAADLREILLGGTLRLPFSLGVAPPGGDADRDVILDVLGFGASGTEPIVQREAVTHFRKGVVLVLPIFLSRACLAAAKPCPTGQTCPGDGTCQDPHVDPATLAAVAPGAELADAGLPPDAPAPVDEGGEAGGDGGPDGGWDAGEGGGLPDTRDAAVDAGACPASCGYGQTCSGGACRCDATHPVSCGSRCCGYGQTCGGGPGGCSVPPAREASGMAYDPVHRVTVMTGGQIPGSNTTLNDTWVWDGIAWTQLQPAHLPATPAAGSPGSSVAGKLVWDQANRRLLLSPWCASGPTASAWDGVDWTRLSTAASRPPETCCGEGLGLAPNGVGVTVGGDTCGLPRANYSAAWNGADFGTPVALGPPGLTNWTIYDPARARFVTAVAACQPGVCVSGYGAWESRLSDPTRWTWTATVAMHYRYQESVTYDTDNGRILQFGGDNGSTASLCSTTSENPRAARRLTPPWR